MPRVVVREFRAGDGAALAAMIRENGAYYAGLAPDIFREPDEDGLVEFREADNEWRESPESFGRIERSRAQSRATSRR